MDSLCRKNRCGGVKRTTRDEPDYGVLMDYRLDLLRKNDFTLAQIQEVIDSLDPLPGAVEFLSELRSKYEVILLSTTHFGNSPFP